MYSKRNAYPSEKSHEIRDNTASIFYTSSYILPNFGRSSADADVHFSDVNVVQMGLNKTKIRFVNSVKTTKATILTFAHFEFVVTAIDVVEINCHIALNSSKKEDHDSY